MASSAFLYDTGMKVRCRRKEQRIIFWAFGKPWIWRGAYLSIPHRNNVFLCEGQTDAISLLDFGAEKDPAKLVVATPSASTLNEIWTPFFKGKDVVLCFDADEAGKKATDRVASTLSGHARTIQALDWEGLRRAC